MILVFFTNIMNEIDRAKVLPILDALPGVYEWSIDLGDCDKVLRVEAWEDVSGVIVSLLSSVGFHCRNMSPDIFI